MGQRLALWALGLLAPLLLLCFVWPFPGGAYFFALATAIFPVALMALGTSRGGRTGPVGKPLLLLLAILVAVMLALLGLRDRVEGGPWVGGLPAAAAVLIYGLFVVPLVVSSLAHAFTFDRWTLPEDRLAELRRRFPGQRSDDAPGDPAPESDRRS